MSEEKENKKNEEDFSSFYCDKCGQLIAYIESKGWSASYYHGEELCPTCFKKRFGKGAEES